MLFILKYAKNHKLKLKRHISNTRIEIELDRKNHKDDNKYVLCDVQCTKNPVV